MEKKLITHKEEPVEKKDNKKLIILCIIIVILVCLVLYFAFIYSSPSNKLKRYLEKHDYTCRIGLCTKEQNKETTEISYKSGKYTFKNDFYTITINNSMTLETKDGYPCTYPKKTNNRLSQIDSELTRDKQCREYIEDVNELVFNYQTMLNEAKVDVNELSK